MYKYLNESYPEDPCSIGYFDRLMVQFAIWGIGSNDFAVACTKVGDDLNDAIGYPCALFSFYATLDRDSKLNMGCYKLGEIRCVMSAYINSVLSGKIPEYKQTKDVLEKIRQEIHRITGKNVGRIGAILDAFYYATNDGRVNQSFYIFPKTYKETVKQRNVPKVIEEVTGSNWSIGDVFKYTALGIVSVAIITVVGNLND
jgi:hypothetical protein